MATVPAEGAVLLTREMELQVLTAGSVKDVVLPCVDCGQYTVKLSNQVSEISADFTVKIRGEDSNQNL